jgi:SlyX protein
MTDESGKRLQLLEEKFEFQESTIDTLNEVIIDQQVQLSKLEEKIKRLEGLLFSMQIEPIAGGGEEPPPPHY